MTDEEMIAFADKASYEQLLHLWRFEPLGSRWMGGEVGKIIKARMDMLYDNMSNRERVIASKFVGWEQ